MNGPAAADPGAAGTGVYRLAGGAAPAGALNIDLAGVREARGLMARIAGALQFPDWFGANWDALEDCLDDLSWREADAHLLLIEGWQSLRGASRADFDRLLEVLESSAEFWAGQGVRFVVLLADPAQMLAGRLAAWPGTGAR